MDKANAQYLYINIVKEHHPSDIEFRIDSVTHASAFSTGVLLQKESSRDNGKLDCWCASYLTSTLAFSILQTQSMEMTLSFNIYIYIYIYYMHTVYIVCMSVWCVCVCACEFWWKLSMGFFEVLLKLFNEAGRYEWQLCSCSYTLLQI